MTNIVNPGLPRLHRGRTRLRLQDCERERPRNESGAGCGGAQRERHGWRESIGIDVFASAKPIPDSGLRPAPE